MRLRSASPFCLQAHGCPDLWSDGQQHAQGEQAVQHRRPEVGGGAEGGADTQEIGRAEGSECARPTEGRRGESTTEGHRASPPG